MRFKKWIASALIVAVMSSLLVPFASATSAGEMLYDATIGNVFDIFTSFREDCEELFDPDLDEAAESIRDYITFWREFYQEGVLDKAAFIQDLKDCVFGGDGSTTITNDDIGRIVSMHPTQSTIDTLSSQSVDGHLLSHGIDSSGFNCVLGYAYSGSGYWYPSMTFVWESSPFTFSADDTVSLYCPPADYCVSTRRDAELQVRVFRNCDGSWLPVSADLSWWPYTRSLTSGTHLARSLTFDVVAGDQYYVSYSVPVYRTESIYTGTYYGYESYWRFDGSFSIKSTSNMTYVPPVTRNSYFSKAITEYNQTVSNITNAPVYNNYFIGTADSQGNVVDVYDFDIFDEETFIVKNPASGDTWTVSQWEYDYETSSYYCLLEDGRYIRITYGDDYVTIIYPDENGNYYEQNYYYVIARSKPVDDSDSVCDHVYTSETTTPPTCLESGWRTLTCSICGHTYNNTLPALGHIWTEVETVPPVIADNGDVVELGYTRYACDNCGEITVNYTGAIPDSGVTPPVESTPDITQDGWFSWLGSLFRTIISTIVDVFSTSLEWVFEHLIMTVIDWLTRAGDWVFSLFDGESLGQLFNWYGPGSALDEEFAQYDSDGSRLEVDVWA